MLKLVHSETGLARGFSVEGSGLPEPQITYPFFQNLYKELIVRNPKKAGS